MVNDVSMKLRSRKRLECLEKQRTDGVFTAYFLDAPKRLINKQIVNNSRVLKQHLTWHERTPVGVIIILRDKFIWHDIHVMHHMKGKVNAIRHEKIVPFARFYDAICVAN